MYIYVFCLLYPVSGAFTIMSKVVCDTYLCIVSGNGGDPNMTDENRMTGLHHICMHSQDIRLLRLLCDNGADLNAEDSHGNTPLLSLCDMATARLYDSFEDLSPCSEDSASSFIGPSAVNAQFLDFLLQMKDVDVSFMSFCIFFVSQDSSTSPLTQKLFTFHTLRPKHLDIILFPMLLFQSGISCLMKFDTFRQKLL